MWMAVPTIDYMVSAPEIIFQALKRTSNFPLPNMPRQQSRGLYLSFICKIGRRVDVNITSLTYL